MSKGRGKGQNFEREVCRDLSLWISKGTRQDLLWRSAMSGGRATVGRSKGLTLAAQAGDICAVDAEGYPFTRVFFAEVKFYRDLDLHGFWTGCGKLHRFWERAKDEAREFKRQPLLIAKQNNYPPMVIFRATSRFNDAAFIRWRSDVQDAAVGMYDDFLKLNSSRWL